MPEENPQQPQRAVVVLLDSLNRHMLGAYGGREFETPNLDRFAQRAQRFTKHFSGSLPCMPARHDLLCGSLDFLWRPWGSIEIWEEPLTAALRRADVTTMLVSDHPHLFETGGENYHCEFSAWEYLRGHEGDPWKTRADPSWMGTPTSGHEFVPYEKSRTYFRSEEDYPGPRTLSAAAAWLDEHGPHHDRFLLFVDEFDPHEPFDTPEPYASMYDETWEGPHLIWPPYATNARENGVLTERQGRQIRAQYGAKLTMIDHWFGRLLDVLDRHAMWDDTAVIVCTDHGHYLGEHDAWGKPQLPIFNVLGHTPLMIAWPGIASREISALSTNVDIHATLLDLFGCSAEHRVHGTSLIPLVTGEATSVREYALAGYWGREVHLIDERWKYARAPVGENEPLSLWSNRWSTMPLRAFPDVRLPLPDERASLDRMPGSTVPVIRQPFREGDVLPYWAWGSFDGSHVYDLDNDPDETRNLSGGKEESERAERLRVALQEIEAPHDQFARLDLN